MTKEEKKGSRMPRVVFALSDAELIDELDGTETEVREIAKFTYRLSYER